MSVQSLTAEGRKPLLVFPHISKTGGTTMLYHFRKSFGDDAVCSYGANGRSGRFFEGKPQFEELSGPLLAEHRLVQGHGVDEIALSRVADRDVRLIAILRHPVRLARSRFSHRTEQMKRRGETVDENEFVSEIAKDQLSDFFCTKFPSFVDDPTASRTERTISVLRKFHYVFTTEMLDQQTRGMMQDLGLPLSMERRRVTETTHVLSVSDAVLEQNNRDDIPVFEAANRLVTDRGSHNPFGFDEQGLSRALARLRDHHNSLDPTSERKKCYTRLASALCSELRAEAALQLLRLGSCPVSDPSLFTGILQEMWDKQRPKLSSQKIRLSEENRKKWGAKRPHVHV